MDCAYELPSLLQLSAEKVASEVNNKYKTMQQYLKRIQLPQVHINYIGNNFVYKTCNFAAYIKASMENSTVMSVVPSMPKGRENSKLKITVGSEKVIYISTLLDLGMDMIKLDFPEGEYELCKFDEGYVLKSKKYSPRVQDIVHVFNSCDRDKGFAVTYQQGYFVQNVHHLRIFNQFISEYTPQEWWAIVADLPGRKVLRYFPAEYLSTIPVLFYLTEKIHIEDLSSITLTCPSVTNNCGNVEVCWYVSHSEKGRIGIAVQQKRYMMSDELGACLFVSNGFRAIGNIDYSTFYNYDDADTRIFDTYGYDCEFEPCFCDYCVDVD